MTITSSFDPVTVSPNCTLTNANLTGTGATGLSGTWNAARQVGNLRNTGKWAVEISDIVITGLNDGTFVGLFSNRDRVQWCIDVDNKLWWSKRTGDTQWNGSGTANPATGVGGLSFSVAGALFAGCCSLTYSAYTRASLRFNFGGSDFIGTVPAGFDPWGASDTLDAAHKSANITLSADALTAINTSQTGAWEGVRSVGSKTTGKWYYEMYECGYARGDLVCLGTCNASYTYGFIGDGSTCFAWDCDGNLYGLSGGASSLSGICGFLETLQADAYPGASYPNSPVTGGHGLKSYNGTIAGASGGVSSSTIYTGINTLMACVDLDAKLIWWIGDNNLWNESGTANPVTGIGGIDISAMSLDEACWGMGFYDAGNSATFNFGATSTVRAVPSGYNMWDNDAPPPPPTSSAQPVIMVTM